MDSLTNTMLKQIIQLNKSFIPAEDLISFLSVSDRTVYNYWKKIEKFLQDYHIEHFLSYDGKGFVFSRNNRQCKTIATIISHMDFYEYHLNSEERPWVILVYLCAANEPITIKNLEDILSMSRTTIINALHSVRGLIEETDLVFEENTQYGVSLTGTEYERRELIFRTAEALHVMDDWHLKEQSFNPFVNLFSELFHMNRYENKVRTAIRHMTDELNLQLSDRKFYRLQFILCVLLDRIENYPVFIPNEIEEPVQQKMLARCFNSSKIISHQTSRRPAIWPADFSSFTSLIWIFPVRSMKHILIWWLSTCCNVWKYTIKLLSLRIPC